MREEIDGSMTSPRTQPYRSLVPMISVAMTTYNLAKTLPKALDSVLEQKTRFPFEIVIGDDCSQDETLEVAHSYRDRHPDLIRVLERPENVGMQRNYYETFEQCRGKYIAWLDGDDYWMDPEKLEIQVQTLELDPSASVCCHYVRVVMRDGEVKHNRSPSLSPGRYGLEQLLHQNMVASVSSVFRNGFQRQLPAWYFDLAPLSDWPIWVLAALSGDIVLLDRVMADYMLTPGSSHSSKGPLFAFKADARFYEHIESILPPKWHRLIRAEKGKRYESVAYLLSERGDFTGSREAALKACSSPFLMDNLGSKIKALVASLAREAEWRLGGSKIAR